MTMGRCAICHEKITTLRTGWIHLEREREKYNHEPEPEPKTKRKRAS